MLESLSVYLLDIGEYKTLSIQAEHDLVVRMRAGDTQAQQELIKSNLKLVVAIAKQYTNSGLPLEDLIQVGNKGLIEAARDFIRRTDTRFKSFADDCVRHEIVDAIRNKPKHTITELKAAEDLSITSDIDTYAERHDLSTKLGQLLETLDPNERAVMFKLASGYTQSDLDTEGKRLLNQALRKSNHPSRSRLLV